MQLKFSLFGCKNRGGKIEGKKKEPWPSSHDPSNFKNI